MKSELYAILSGWAFDNQKIDNTSVRSRGIFKSRRCHSELRDNTDIDFHTAYIRYHMHMDQYLPSSGGGYKA